MPVGRLVGVDLTRRHLLTKSPKIAIKASLFIEMLQTIAYYGWENLWNHIEWGMITKHD